MMAMDMRDECEIKILLSSIVDLVDLISVHFNTKIRMYLVEHLLLSMRELSFYANKYIESKIDNTMKSNVENIKNIRNAICHRSSEKNWLKGNIKIQGASLFREEDVEIQYGEYHIFLIGGVVDLYKNFREAFFDPKYSFQIRGNPYGYEREETKLKMAIEKLVESIEQFVIDIQRRTCE